MESYERSIDLDAIGRRRLREYNLQPNRPKRQNTHPMKLLNTFESNNYTTLFDYSVVDQSGENIGSVSNLWNSEHTGTLEFLGVKTGWLFGSNHVVPVEGAQIDEAARTIQLPYLLAKIKDAPTIDADATISDDEEARIYRYYGLTGSASGSTATTSATVATHESERAGTATTGLTTGAAAGTVDTHAAGTARVAGDDKIEVALREEQLKVGKRTVEAGAVRLRKIVRTEIVNQPVEIRHEDVVVERVSADEIHAGDSTPDFTEQTIDVPLTREEVVVSKDTHVTGAVRVSKTAEVETQNVSETVRKEDVEVVRDGKTVTERDERASR